MSSGLERAHDLQQQAAALGFDWPDIETMLDKVTEELSELRAAQAATPGGPAVVEELGDILFVLVNVARRLQVSPDKVLAAACDKFDRRFSHVLRSLARQGLSPERAGLQAMEALWQEAKCIERGTGQDPA